MVPGFDQDELGRGGLPAQPRQIKAIRCGRDSSLCIAVSHLPTSFYGRRESQVLIGRVGKERNSYKGRTAVGLQ
jgi:hypothetical protein